MSVSRNDLNKIVREASREATKETMITLGFSVEEPQQMQADLIYLRKMRKGSEFISLRAKASFVAFLIPTVLYLLWDAVKDAVSSK